MTSVVDILERAAGERGESAALVEVGERGRLEVSCQELFEEAQRVGGALHDAGVMPGDRVALQAGSGIAHVACWFGVLTAGATVVPVPAPSAVPETVFRLRHARCRAVLSDDRCRERVGRAVAAAGGPIVHLDVQTARAELAPPVDSGEGAVAMVLYTSGTTSKAKGACITHRSLLLHTDALVQHVLGLRPGDRVLGVLPLSHSFGIRMTVLCVMAAGGVTVLLPRFDAGASLAAAEREGVVFLPGVPTMFAAWAAVEGPPLPSLRWCLSAGAPLADETLRRAEARLGAEVRQGYGLTEATFTTINAPPDRRVPGSVGLPVPGVDVRILDPATGEDVAPGETGEVVVRGQNVMSGYLDDEESTRACRLDGWQRTGDLGRLDGDGRLFVVDRLKDLILRGGFNVVPSEVEEALAAHPGVAAAAVVGRSDPYYGEEVVAVVVRRAGIDVEPAALDAWCRARLSPQKVPREIAFVDALPLGPSRKVLRRTLRDRIADGSLRPKPVPRAFPSTG